MATPFAEEIDSDILISSPNGFKTPIIFLTKLIYLFETVSQPRRRCATRPSSSAD